MYNLHYKLYFNHKKPHQPKELDPSSTTNVLSSKNHTHWLSNEVKIQLDLILHSMKEKKEATWSTGMSLDLWARKGLDSSLASIMCDFRKGVSHTSLNLNFLILLVLISTLK